MPSKLFPQFLLTALIITTGVLSLVAQTASVSLQIRAVLVDTDLNLKPVPKLKLIIYPEKNYLTQISTGVSEEEAEISISTGFDGFVGIELPPGPYVLRTPQPVNFQGKSYSWIVPFRLTDTQEHLLELSIDNAEINELQAPKPIHQNDFSEEFERLKDGVVTVWSEFGHGTGFFVDETLILTNQHVVGPSEYISVQFDPATKVRAILLASSPEKDIAILAVHPDALPAHIVVPLADVGEADQLVIVGEQVFTIGSPLNQRKIMTTGIVSDVKERVIVSDININPGNSGGPLFNSEGFVVGLTTFGDFAFGIGPGISGIVRIEEAIPLLEEAKEKLGNTDPPSPEKLLVEPTDTFPLDALKAAVAAKKFDEDPYKFNKHKFDVTIFTPPFLYYSKAGAAVQATREQAKRTKQTPQSGQGSLNPLDDFHGWAEYVGEYRPVIIIRAMPELRETFWSAFGRGLSQGMGKARLRFRTDFHKMRLLCGGEEIEPIHPGRIPHIMTLDSTFVNIVDATYEGLYVYPPDSISPSCGKMTLELYTEKEPTKVKKRDLDRKTIARIWKDFEPYREMHNQIDTSVANESGDVTPASQRKSQ